MAAVTIALGGGNAAKHGNSSFAQNMFDYGFAQPRRIVVKLQVVRFLIEAEFVQSVGIREAAEGAKLLGLQLILKLIGHGHEGHGGIIAK